MPKVSIIMRSINDMEFIEATFQGILEQNFQDFEIVNVDSGSTDGTYELIQKYNKGTVYQIRPEEYVPGPVLNTAISRAKGELIVFNNSDCIPQNQDWLGNLIAPLSDSGVAASFGRQIPRSDSHPLVVKDYERAFGDGSISSQWHHFFSLATSAVPKDLITKYPFDLEVQYSEDIEWSYRMKKKGYEIEYVPDAIVEHSHNYTMPQVYKRFYEEGRAEAFIYGPDFKLFSKFLRPLGMEILRDIFYLVKTGNYDQIPYGLQYRAVQKYATYKGNKDFFNGNTYQN
ncbi:MAG: glycosyltransferase [Candidatus Marinimicrobia bacterium]|nr:glycosyltransferase [Candidatus Neomarinimicrobiota bacterium]